MSIYKTVVPPIKCQGIKTKLVPWIIGVIPSDFQGYWIEPFMGSGVVAFNVRPRKAILADSNPHLINFYKAVANGKITASIVKQFLQHEGSLLLETAGEHYYVVRDRFNQKADPLDFLFLNRSCFNGMIRFNKKGGFNVPFCRKPKRFAQAYVTKICNQVQSIADTCALGNYEFRCQDYRDTIAEARANDLLYCDPPYIYRHVDYYNGWTETNEQDLAKALTASKARFILSTWHSNQYRSNPFIETLWAGFKLLTREHFYHIGAKEANRNAMLEALITNYNADYNEHIPEKLEQLKLFNSALKYRLMNETD